MSMLYIYTGHGHATVRWELFLKIIVGIQLFGVIFVIGFDNTFFLLEVHEI